MPLVAVGLLYQQGYFRQVLNPDGWQQERYPINDFYTLPITPGPRQPGRRAEGHGQAAHRQRGRCRSGRLSVGRVKLFLLDTNIPDNLLPQDRDITDSLYGGDHDTRMRQEIVLGIGGARALEGHGLRAHRLPHE